MRDAGSPSNAWSSGMTDEVSRHDWMKVVGVAGAGPLVRGDALAIIEKEKARAGLR